MKKTKFIVLLLLIGAAATALTVTKVSADSRRTGQEKALEIETTETEAPTEAQTEAPATLEITTEAPTEAVTEAVTVLETEPETETEPEPTGPVAFQQTDPRWCDIPYGYGNWAGTSQAYLGRGGRNGFGGGCGVFATVNAAYYANGSFIEPADLADYAVSNGFRISGVGTDEGMVRSFIKDRGGQYGLYYIRTARRLSSIQEDLANGAVAVAHLNGHFIAVVDYDYDTDQFLVLDSAAVEERGTLPDGVRWMRESEFTGKMTLSESDGALQVFGAAD